MLPSIEWKDKGKCASGNVDPNYFYPNMDTLKKAIETTETPNKRRINLDDIEETHAGFCRGIKDGIVCPVLEKCKEYAIVNHEHGVWGGTSEIERRRIRRKRAMATTAKKKLIAANVEVVEVETNVSVSV